MAGTNRATGRPLDGWDHLIQSLEVLFTTRLASRVMLRIFGFNGLRLLGENMTPTVVLRFVTAIIVAVELWEPRYRIRRLEIVPEQNSPEQMRLGRLRFAIIGEYRPRGHLGDPTPETDGGRIYIGLGQGGTEVIG